jgi:hypothetical protein
VRITLKGRLSQFGNADFLTTIRPEIFHLFRNSRVQFNSETLYPPGDANTCFLDFTFSWVGYRMRRSRNAGEVSTLGIQSSGGQSGTAESLSNGARLLECNVPRRKKRGA